MKALLYNHFSVVCLALAATISLSAGAHAAITQVGTGGASPLPVPMNNLLQSATLSVNSNAAFADGDFIGSDTTGAVLTNLRFGGGGTPPTETATINTGAILTYSFGAAVDISQIASFTGWRDSGRVAHNYNVLAELASNLGTFTPLYSVNFNSGDNNQSVVATDTTGKIVSNVSALRFEFPNVQNGYVGYRELSVQGFLTGAVTGVTQFNQQGSDGDFVGSALEVPTTNLLQAATLTVSPTTPNPLRDRENIFTTGTAAALTDGDFGRAGIPGAGADPHPDIVIISGTDNVQTDPAVLTYSFATPMNITQIASYTGWQDSGRSAQDYIVSAEFAGLSGSFSELYTVGYDSGQRSAAVIATNTSGIIAANVTALRFSFPNVQNGYVGYRELSVQGSAVAVVPEAGTVALVAAGFFPLAIGVVRRRAKR